MPRKAMTKTTTKAFEDENMGVVEKNVSPKTKNEFAPHDGILCHSVWAGGLNITCRSGNFYEFKDYGSTMMIEYQDLAALTRKHSEHIFLPRIIIDDEDFLDEFPQIKDFYEEIYSISDLKDLLLSPPATIKATLKLLPESVIPTIRSLAATMVGNGEIDSIKTVKTLTEIFGSDFNLLSELFAEK